MGKCSFRELTLVVNLYAHYYLFEVKWENSSKSQSRKLCRVVHNTQASFLSSYPCFKIFTTLGSNYLTSKVLITEPRIIFVVLFYPFLL